MVLSKAFKRFRKEFNQTQKEVAEHANVDVRTYQNYEYGEIVPSATVLIAIADFYNVSIDYLVGRTDNPKINR
ncbi:MAG TPA: XRE family transcriptional regulator [Clostridiales bacterium]|jgi:transcriptional regulator with XRE-family HTH domain|uniref:Helix-turn-helix transcriptional regulator n=1 Tax=Congzhengia minquanensis TaxID=2763657 RepID=A0A926DLJ3_9FIRM|nr:helix-turn-helix transcriptional regulator [Congzhengia minquanensis]MBC8539934.1 helix-turn-helix transcriptional regulator [Congzhengia minquanensis]MBD8946814.1 XRE family transcriptional regulator [Clostridiales bacterium]HBL82970.1 XRE family transcriptional regulator [Clostridiales bacterium]